MGKSSRPRLRELRDAYRLVGECRDLGGRVRDWREHLLAGLRRLVGAQVGLAAEVRGDGPTWKEALHAPADVGWDSAAARAVLMDFEMERSPADDVTFAPLVGLARPLVTRRREQLIADDAWYSSAVFNEYRRTSGVDDWVHSLSALGDPRAIHLIVLLRPPGAARFAERERRLVHLLHHELARLVGPVLLREPDRVITGLPPRLRQVLECLLEGDSEKQVAVRLGLSRPTVHEYVTALYRRFEVSSRAELLARCLRLQAR
ncbi:helix-turn-helix transcriptional regulator [Tautonia plasticadhaerens]|uniref:Bacterial regulatory protein, luxR family n=1 Tax=Tautonia plasticadhaerens TaxID=2527974 RepID=A0A518HCC5_9BACT|nr:helix-turn-helix transcriptional regulator [Tautonia plasticadhaerens]QDV38512.1 Bacterial regulatory protein, luxR family [Tautonia plasticadhaerens]